MPDQPTPKGELEAIMFGEKILTVKRRCSCGGDVEVKKDPVTEVSTATCLKCGASLQFGGKQQK
jgi:hypothetical protein